MYSLQYKRFRYLDSKKKLADFSINNNPQVHLGSTDALYKYGHREDPLNFTRFIYQEELASLWSWSVWGKRKVSVDIAFSVEKLFRNFIEQVKQPR